MDRAQYDDLLRRIDHLEQGYHRWRRTALTAISIAVTLVAFSAYGYSQRQRPTEQPGPVVQPLPKEQKVPEPGKTVSVEIDATTMRTTYTNFFRITGNPDEVVLDLGFYSQVQTKNGNEPAKLTERLIMNFLTAKKLRDALKTVVARHEDAFGEIELDPSKSVKPKPKID